MTAFGSVTICASLHFLKLSLHFAVVGCASHEGCRLPLNLRAPPSMTGWPKLNGDDLPPSLREHYTRFIATTEQSAPLQRIGTFSLTFSLADGVACAFSLRIAGKVLTFRTRA